MFEKDQSEQAIPMPRDAIAPPPHAQITAEDEEKRRPPNAFILFDRAMRQAMAIQNPELTTEEINRSMGSLWQLTDEQVRNVYRQQAQELKELWHQLHPGEVIEMRKKRISVSQAKTPEPIRIRVILDAGSPLASAIPHPATVDPPLLVPGVPTHF